MASQPGRDDSSQPRTGPGNGEDFLAVTLAGPRTARPLGNDPSGAAAAQWNEFMGKYPLYADSIEEIRDLMYDVAEGEDEMLRFNEQTPLEYMDFVYTKVVPRWDRYVLDWPISIDASPSTLRYYQFKVDLLGEKLESINMIGMRMLYGPEGIPEDEEFDENRECETGVLNEADWLFDLKDAIKTVQRPCRRLARVEHVLRSICEDARALLNDGSTTNGIRRRRIGEDSTADGRGTHETELRSTELEERSRDAANPNLSDRSAPPSPSFIAGIADVLNAVDLRVSRILMSRHALRRTLLWLAVSQSTLWTLAMTTGVLSAMVVTFSAAQSRPVECVPSMSSPDDSTWALVAQIPVSLFSLYTTLLPIIREKSLYVRPFWFVVGLSLSAVMTIASPLVYGVSWRASTILTYLASIFAMTCTTQLAGSIMDGLNSHELVQ